MAAEGLFCMLDVGAVAISELTNWEVHCAVPV